MTFEERLDRIGERHEALAQSVELLANMQRKSEEHAQRNDQRLGQLMDAMTRLVRIVENHEHRLDDLEGRG